MRAEVQEGAQKQAPQKKTETTLKRLARYPRFKDTEPADI